MRTDILHFIKLHTPSNNMSKRRPTRTHFDESRNHILNKGKNIVHRRVRTNDRQTSVQQSGL
jgi:hypothetical protein